MGSKLHCILLVEDNFMTNLFNEKMLENLCVADHIVTAENGEEALKYLEDSIRNHTYPELLLVDIFMPGMSGWELCALLRRQSATREIPVLFLTGRQEVRDRITAMQVGGSDYLAKPFGAEDLRRKVNSLLKPRATREDE